MRPLIVLLLVLGAVAALLVAVTTLSEDGPRGPITTPRADRTAETSAPAERGELAVPVERDVSRPEEAEVREVVRSMPVASVESGAQSGLLWGSVVDPNGTPIAGARLSLLRVKGGPSVLGEGLHLLGEGAPPRPVRQLETDREGGFRFEGIAPGRDWTIVATHPKFVRVEVGPIDVPVEGGIEERIVLKFGRVLTGRVVDSITRAPLTGARLVVENPLSAFLPSSRRQEGRVEAVTDDKGFYTFNNLGTGQRSLTLTAPGYATQYHANFTNTLAELRRGTQPVDPTENVFGTRKIRNPEAAPPEEPRGPMVYDFAMAPGKTIAGRVVGPDRRGVEGVEVLAINQAGEVGSRGTALTVAGGEFVIEDLGEGVYTLRPEAEGYQATPVQRIEVGTTDVEIVMAEQGGVSGRVVDAETGKPLSSFICRVRTHHPRNVAWGSQVAERSFQNRRDGTFTIQGVSEGEFVVEAVARGYASSFSEAFRVEQGIQTGDVLVRVTKGGTLRGRVVDSYTGEPIVGAVVSTNDNNYVDSEIMALFANMSSSATSKEEAKTDDKGEFELELLTPATYQLRIEKPDYTAIVQNDVNVADGVPTELGTFSLMRGATVTGRVVGPDGEPIPGANVVMHHADPGLMMSYSARTDAQGRYRLKNARPGDYKLSASRPMGPNSNPFAPVVDLRHSEIEVSVADGQDYDFQLTLGPAN